MRVPAEGGDTELITEGQGYWIAWAPDGIHFYFQKAGNIWIRSAKNGTELPVTDLEGRRGTLGWDLAADEQYVYFTWREDFGDIWVMDVVRE